MRRVRAATTIVVTVALCAAAGIVAVAVPGSARQRADSAKPNTSTTKLRTEAQCLATPDIRIPCYDPAQIQTAYDEGPLFRHGLTGTGETIVIVDSFGSPTVKNDLATFDTQFGLSPPPAFDVIQPAGPVPRFNPKTTTMVGWAGETTLDVEWAHAIAPGAKILLVETPVAETEGTAGFPQIVAAENYVIDHHLGDVISQSFGATEASFTSPGLLLALRSAFVNAAAHGVTVLAASGDTGATGYLTATRDDYSTEPVVTWPASDPLVTGVGGTRLSLNASGRRTAPDRAWNDTYDPVVNDFLYGNTKPHPDAGGGGLSVIFSRPSYQDSVAGVVGNSRGVPDISMSAACSGLVDTYQSFAGPTPPGWYYVCGSSEATPMFAGIVALADQMARRPLGLINPALYAMAAAHDPGIVTVSQGNNTVSFFEHSTEDTVQGYTAGPGYNLVSGLGTINAALFVPELVHTVKTVSDDVTYGYLERTATQ